MSTCWICGAIISPRATWRMMRGPDLDTDVTEIRVHGSREPIAVVVDGPEGRDLCAECWHAAEGFLIELRGTKERRVQA